VTRRALHTDGDARLRVTPAADLVRRVDALAGRVVCQESASCTRLRSTASARKLIPAIARASLAEVDAVALFTTPSKEFSNSFRTATSSVPGCTKTVPCSAAGMFHSRPWKTSISLCKSLGIRAVQGVDVVVAREPEVAAVVPVVVSVVRARRLRTAERAGHDATERAGRRRARAEQARPAQEAAPRHLRRRQFAVGHRGLEYGRKVGRCVGTIVVMMRVRVTVTHRCFVRLRRDSQMARELPGAISRRSANDEWRRSNVGANSRRRMRTRASHQRTERTSGVEGVGSCPR
jgi:hypothetical protein